MARPPFEPTDEQRRSAKAFAALGFTHDTIARAVGIRSAKTLRKHFRLELHRGELDANASVATTLFKLANSGLCPAASMLWLKCRAGWREQRDFSVSRAAAPPFIVKMDDEEKS